MLDSLRVTTRGVKRTRSRATLRLFLKWKNTQESCAIFDDTLMDPRKPPKFKLPGLEGLLGWLGAGKAWRGGGRRVYLAKLDLHNAFWLWYVRNPFA